MTPTTPRPTRIAGALAIALAPLLVTVTANAAAPDAAKGAAPGDDNTRVRILFRNAAAASQSAKYEEARQLLMEAWTIRQTYDVASSLAQVEMQLKLYRDAAEHLEFCIRNFAPVESEQTLEQAKKAFTDVKTRVAVIKLSANKKGATLFVDGLDVGLEPLSRLIFVEPGMRRFTAQLANTTTEQSLKAESGKEYIAELNLSTPDTAVVSAVGSGIVDAPVGSANAPLPVQKSSYAPALATASVGVAALATGVVLLIEAGHKNSQWHEQLNQLPGAVQCGAQNPNAATCDEIQSRANDARTFRALSLVAFGATAAAGVATYFLWPRAPSSSQLGVRAMALPSRAGIDIFTGIDGTF